MAGGSPPVLHLLKGGVTWQWHRKLKHGPAALELMWRPLERPGGTMENIVHYYREKLNPQINGLIQKRRNSIASAMELRLFCIKPLRDGLMQKRCNSNASAME